MVFVYEQGQRNEEYLERLQGNIYAFEATIFNLFTCTKLITQRPIEIYYSANTRAPVQLHENELQ